MSSRHLVDPELAGLLETYLPGGVGADNLGETRRARADLAAAAPVPDDGVRRERLRVPGPPGAPDVDVVVYTPPDPASTGATGATGVTERPGLLHVHGGGFVMGAAAEYDLLNRTTARLVDCVVVSVDYRLAPETPYPGPVEDCYAALVWLGDHATEVGVDPARLGIKGESAGGGLAAATALLARDRGGPALRLQHLLYPMLDDRTVTTADPHPYAGEFVWTPATNRFGWEAMLGAAQVGGPEVSAYAAPARADDLSGLPPTFIATGDLDLFLEEDLDYARRLTRAGVPVEMHVYPGAFHAFGNAREASVSVRAERDMVEALRRGLGTADR